MRQHWILIGSILGALGVGLGAFGAHGLADFLAQRHAEDPELLARRMGNWDTAALYQMHHAIALVLAGVVSMFRQNKWLTAAGFSFLFGVLLFSGSLYALVLFEVPVLGAITPLGGIGFIIGWLALAIGGCCMNNGLTQIDTGSKSANLSQANETGNPFESPNAN